MPNEQEIKQAADELNAHVVEIIKWHFFARNRLSILARLGKGTKLESNRGDFQF